jgi:hypothetical protein
VIVRGTALAALLVFVPTPAYAHAVGSGAGVEIELLLVAVAVLFLGFRLRSAANAKPAAPWVAIGAGVALAILAFALPQVTQSSKSSDASLRIVSPTDGAELAAGKPVAIEVDVRGGTVATSPTDTGKGHLHIYVDGELQQMPFSTSAEVRLPAGEHDITVEYVDADHVSFDPSVQASVTVEVVQ